MTCDVIVVGYGPVGMCAAALLGQAGYRVVVLERYAGLYNLPRAATFDDEIMRTFARLGISERLLPTLYASRNYEWRNGAGDLLIDHELSATGRSGWAEWYHMYQPALEDALDAACRATGNVEIRFGERVVDYQERDDVVFVRTEQGVFEAPWVVACDGGNSFARRALAIGEDDLGFSEPWLVCDFRITGRPNLPMARQVCDPRQPTSIISLGPLHHRFSFMLGSASDFERECAPERVWSRVAPYLQPADGELVRVATYTFRSLVAHTWRRGHVLLAGDAAHQMPPFLGQGMCSGIRDATNLAFKLDLVLRGAHARLLDTYQTEREPQVRAVIERGVQLGRIQTMRDPIAAAERDRKLLAGRAPENMRFPGIGAGMLAKSGGELFPQGRVDDGQRSGRFDEVMGYGWALVAREQIAMMRPPVDVVCTLDQIKDIDGTYARWLDERRAFAVVVRPDFYVYGVASDATMLGELLTELAQAKEP